MTISAKANLWKYPGRTDRKGSDAVCLGAGGVHCQEGCALCVSWCWHRPIIHNWVPEEFIVKLLGTGNPFGVVIATIAGVPMYADIFGTMPIAEALGKKLAADVFESYSAGTETKPRINQDAVRLMKQVHGIDMEAAQHCKLLSDIPAVDVVVTMGCNVQCPLLPCSHREDWGLEDPSGKSDDAFLETIRLIEEKVLDLKARLK